MVTIKDIAQAVGVSPSTVSRALGDSPLVNNETRQRILKAARKLGYERNELARGLVKGTSWAVGLVVPDITNPFFSDVARGVSEIADRVGYGVILCNTDGRIDRELSYIRLLRRKRVDGLLICSATLDAPFIQDLTAAGTPFVLVSRLSADSDVPYVVTDDQAGGRLAVEHLVDLGHRRIGFIGGPEDVQASRDRMDAYFGVLAEHAIHVPDTWCCHADFTQTAGRQAGQRMLSLVERPTAIFAANDDMAAGVLRAAAQLGFPVPDRLSVAGCDDISLASQLCPTLTTIRQPLAEMAERAATVLISEAQKPSLPQGSEVVPATIRFRESTGRCPAQRGRAQDGPE